MILIWRNPLTTALNCGTTLVASDLTGVICWSNLVRAWNSDEDDAGRRRRSCWRVPSGSGGTCEAALGRPNKSLLSALPESILSENPRQYALQDLYYKRFKRLFIYPTNLSGKLVETENLFVYKRILRN